MFNKEFYPENPNSEAPVNPHRDINRETPSDAESINDQIPQSWRFDPTIPRSLSGLPRKSADALLDPERLRTGMCFALIDEGIHFVYKYENRHGYEWIRKSNIRTSTGMC